MSLIDTSPLGQSGPGKNVNKVVTPLSQELQSQLFHTQGTPNFLGGGWGGSLYAVGEFLAVPKRSYDCISNFIDKRIV